MYRFILFITFLYVIVEAQALSALMALYNSTVSPAIMGELEQLGYVTAALGVTVAGVKFILRTGISKHALWLAVPLLYVSGFELIHGVVNRLPLLIEDKPAALRAGVQTLSSPHPSNIILYWHPDTRVPAVTRQQANDFNARFSVSDSVVQNVFIDGINNLATFHQLYQRETQMLTHEHIRTMRVRTMQGLYAKEGDPVSYNSAINLLAYERYIQRLSPYHWAKNQLAEEGLKRHNPVLSELVDVALADYPSSGILLPQDVPVTNVDKYYVMEKVLLQKAWDTWRDSMPYLGPYPASNEPFRDKFRRAVTGHFITPLTGDTQLIPLDRKGQERYFLSQAERIAPFFFKQGDPLLSLSKLYDWQTRRDYINNIDNSLHPTLRQAFDEYRGDSIYQLSKDPVLWSRPIDRELNIDLVRVGAILPAMLLLSAILVILNILLTGTRWQDKCILVAGLAAGLAIAHSPIAMTVREYILLLSYRAPQVFIS